MTGLNPVVHDPGGGAGRVGWEPSEVGEAIHGGEDGCWSVCQDEGVIVRAVVVVSGPGESHSQVVVGSHPSLEGDKPRDQLTTRRKKRRSSEGELELEYSRFSCWSQSRL